MPHDAKRLLYIASAFLAVLILIPVIGRLANSYVGYFLFLEFVVLLPLLVLMSADALHALDVDPGGKKAARVAVRLIASGPVLVFGLLGIICGGAGIVWVLYNLLIERQPEFNGSFYAGFGIGPAVLLFGIAKVLSVFRRAVKTEVEAEVDESDT
ncbi:hypothetical protein [Shewanella cyperi]|uniref:hypothetical protein n=1 Tax=Shewanella cyperi TaxID=2814292 RepID=UPI001A949B6A|nr:hypothetical protein [Shewanella cyperi]QSX42399.1 hypothetical protein JYB84_08405 [Shewanella cyperi]